MLLVNYLLQQNVALRHVTVDSLQASAESESDDTCNLDDAKAILLLMTPPKHVRCWFQTSLRAKASFMRNSRSP